MHAHKQLKIAFWNAQSINNNTKKISLESFLETDKIDILLLAETFLKPTISFQINNFTIYRNDRKNAGHGGVAVAIRSSIPHKILPPMNTQHIETITIEIEVEKKPLRITSAYSPRPSIHFKRDIQQITSSNEPFMIFGDFNALHPAWNCQNTNTAGKSLYDLQLKNDFIIYNTPDHTHFPHSGRTPSTIDLLLSNSSINFNLSTYHDHFMSDHAPIVCTTNSNVHHLQQKLFDFSKANWKEYQRIINQTISESQLPNTVLEVDIAIKNFTKLIQL